MHDYYDFVLRPVMLFAIELLYNLVSLFHQKLICLLIDIYIKKFHVFLTSKYID